MLSVRLALKKVLQRLGIIADFIVETGTSGIWTYEKRNSGIAECWGVIVFGEIALTTNMASGVYSSSTYAARSQTLPSGLFSEVKYVNANVTSNGYHQTQVAAYSETAVTYRVWSSYPGSPTSVEVLLEVKGYWKTPNLGGVVRNLLQRWWCYG